MAFFRKTCSIAWLGAAVFSLAAPAALAWPNFSWPPGAVGPVKKAEVFNEQAQFVVWQVSHNPALMNVNYLAYFIGRPENDSPQLGAQKHYYWYDPQRQPVYELIQQEVAPGAITDSQMIIHLKGQGLTFDKLDKLYGKQSRRFYNYDGHPTELFSFVPNTTLAFGSQQNSFRLTSAKVIYRGSPLPLPTADDMAAGESAMIARARASALARNAATTKGKGNGKGIQSVLGSNDPEFIPMMMKRVKTQPYSSEAHLHLAQGLQRQARIHEAIGEYKIALALSGDDPQVRDQALKALGAMQLLPPETPMQRRNFEIVDNGQHIRVVGNEQTSQQQQQQQQQRPQAQYAQNPDAATF
jgi:hypothetical protein